jgi:hypothetical protein
MAVISNKMLMQKNSAREKLMVVVLGTLLVIGGYFMFRVKPFLHENKVLDERLQFTQQNERENRPMTGGGSSIVSMRKKLVDLKASYEQEKSTLDGLQNSFIDLSQNDAEAIMRNQITDLVDQEGLRLLSIRSSDTSLEKLAQVSAVVSSEELARPLFEILLKGHFNQLRSFIEGLKTLPYSIVITKFDLSATYAGGGQKLPTGVLQVLLTVAI